MEILDYRDEDGKIHKRLLKAIKKKDYEKVERYIKKTREDKRKDILWYIMADEPKYIDKDILRIMLNYCVKFDLEYFVNGLEYFLNSRKFDLVEVYYEFGWTPSKKFIDKYENEYQAAIEKLASPLSPRHEHDGPISDFREYKVQSYKEILNFLRPHDKL